VRATAVELVPRMMEIVVTEFNVSSAGRRNGTTA
jgi:hypothetical protein